MSQIPQAPSLGKLHPEQAGHPWFERYVYNTSKDCYNSTTVKCERWAWESQEHRAQAYRNCRHYRYIHSWPWTPHSQKPLITLQSTLHLWISIHRFNQSRIEKYYSSHWKKSAYKWTCAVQTRFSKLNCILSDLAWTLTSGLSVEGRQSGTYFYVVKKKANIRASVNFQEHQVLCLAVQAHWDLGDLSPEPPKAHHLPAAGCRLKLHSQSISLVFASAHQTCSKNISLLPISPAPHLKILP